ncbi:MAG TPA: HAD hydrolase family protein [bacterium]|nr:HAD hydrolase family protein [bacterium]
MKKKKITDKDWRKIKLIIMDVDGVLTKNDITYYSNGCESKTFNVKDGRGIIEAQTVGIKFGIITARGSEMVLRRATELGIEYIYQNAKNKLAAFLDILKKTKCSADETIYMGDEVIDIPVMLKTGIAIAVNDAANDVLKVADYITKKNGGDGAVREVIELLLTKQKKWSKIISKYFE